MLPPSTRAARSALAFLADTSVALGVGSATRAAAARAQAALSSSSPHARARAPAWPRPRRWPPSSTSPAAGGRRACPCHHP